MSRAQQAWNEIAKHASHARFAPSSAHRWLNCTASVDAASRYDDPPSEAAQEGSAAHFILERCLIDGGQPSAHVGRTIVVKERGVERSFAVTRDMARDVALGVDTVREIASHPGVSGVEARVSLERVDPDLWGTTDLWHWGQDGVLTICDFKFGRGDVDATGNEQLMIYAAAALERLATNVVPEVITLVIVQPRSVAPTPRVKRWSLSAQELFAFVDRVIGAIAEARRAPTFTAGPWCEHCPALGECPATSDHRGIAPSLLTADMTVRDAERIVGYRDLLAKVVERAEKTLLEAMLLGHKSSFPLVTKNKHRQWRDVDLARQRISDEIGPQALEAPTPAGCEKFGPAGKAIAQELAFTPPGEPTIGKPGDKRAAYLPKSAETMFGASK